MRRSLLLLTVCSVAVLAWGQLHAQNQAGNQPAPAVDPALFEGLSYRLVGPPRGGRVTTVTGVPS